MFQNRLELCSGLVDEFVERNGRTDINTSVLCQYAEKCLCGVLKERRSHPTGVWAGTLKCSSSLSEEELRKRWSSNEWVVHQVVARCLVVGPVVTNRVSSSAGSSGLLTIRYVQLVSDVAMSMMFCMVMCTRGYRSQPPDKSTIFPRLTGSATAMCRVSRAVVSRSGGSSTSISA